MLIAGQSPKMQWRPNPGGRRLTVEAAVGLARRFGVVVPDYVVWYVDEDDELSAEFTARGPRVRKHAGTFIVWSDLVNERTGKVPFILWPGLFDSDEAAVAVIAHEMYELRKIRRLLKRTKATVDQLIGLTCAGNPGNLHDEAWDVADEVVLRMRKGGEP